MVSASGSLNKQLQSLEGNVYVKKRVLSNEEKDTQKFQINIKYGGRCGEGGGVGVGACDFALNVENFIAMTHPLHSVYYLLLMMMMIMMMILTIAVICIETVLR